MILALVTGNGTNPQIRMYSYTHSDNKLAPLGTRHLSDLTDNVTILVQYQFDQLNLLLDLGIDLIEAVRLVKYQPPPLEKY
jgi:hypothetical protein